MRLELKIIYFAIAVLILIIVMVCLKKKKVEEFTADNMKQITLPPQNTSLHIDLSSDGKKLCAFTGPNVFVYKYPFNQPPSLTISKDYISSMDLSHDGKLIILALAESDSNKVKIQMHDSETGKVKDFFTVEDSEFSAYSSRVRSNDKGDTLAIFTDTKDSGVISIYENKGGKWAKVFKGIINNDRLPRIGISGNGRTVVYVGEATSKISVIRKSEDGVWDNDAAIDLLGPGPTMVSDDGNTIVSAVRSISSIHSSINVYSRKADKTWEKTSTLEPQIGDFVNVDVNSDGTFLVGTTPTSCYSYVKTDSEWKITNVLPIAPQGAVNSTVLSSDGSTFAFADSALDGNIFIY